VVGFTTKYGIGYTKMTDKQILEKVYGRLVDVEANWDKMTMDRMFDRWHDIKDFIEQEWQKADEAASGNYDMNVLK